MNILVFFIRLTFLIGSISAVLLPRIIGGEDGDIKDFPYLAGLIIQGDLDCSATIISERHVLTAAHCVTNHGTRVEVYSNIIVKTGTISNSKDDDSHRVSKIDVHPGWTGKLRSSKINDIAVITLADKIKFNEERQKIKLPDEDVVTGTDCVLTGWGMTSENSDVNPDKLQKLKMTILDNSDCQSQHSWKIEKSQLCAYHSKGHGPCAGDSGGPLVDDINQLVGITSWRPYKSCSGVPEVFTNIYAHKAFIETHTGFKEEIQRKIGRKVIVEEVE